MTNEIFVTGGNGMVGSQVDFGICLSHKELDVTNKISISVALNHYQPRTVLHLAALLDMKECETNPQKAREINTQGSANIAQECAKRGIRLVCLSSCAVFDGTKGAPYVESDNPNPLNEYGKTKLAGERQVLQILPSALVIRTGWLFGGGTGVDKRFVKFVFDELSHHKNMKATNDRRGSPTYVPDLLKMVVRLLELDYSGIIHVVNSGFASYYDIASEVKRQANFENVIFPASYLETESGSMVKRGEMEALSSEKISPLRSWKEALNEYIIKLHNYKYYEKKESITGSAKI